MGSEKSTMNQREPRPGDLIEITRGTFSHWAVYIGGGIVVHLVTSSAISSGSESALPGPDGVVKINILEDVVEDSKWEIKNLLDDTYEPRDAKVIVKEALKAVETKQHYHLLDNNCEHFATQLRYGKGESRQVKVAEGAVAATSAIIGVGATIGLTVSLVSSRK